MLIHKQKYHVHLTNNSMQWKKNEKMVNEFTCISILWLMFLFLSRSWCKEAGERHTSNYCGSFSGEREVVEKILPEVSIIKVLPLSHFLTLFFGWFYGVHGVHFFPLIFIWSPNILSNITWINLLSFFLPLLPDFLDSIYSCFCD